MNDTSWTVDDAEGTAVGSPLTVKGTGVVVTPLATREQGVSVALDVPAGTHLTKDQSIDLWVALRNVVEADPPVWVGADPSPDDIMAAASAVVRSLTEAGVTVKAADVWSMASGYPNLTIQVDWEGREKAAALLGFTYEGRHRDGTALFDAWVGAVGFFFRTCLTSMSWVEGEE